MTLNEFPDQEGIDSFFTEVNTSQIDMLSTEQAAAIARTINTEDTPKRNPEVTVNDIRQLSGSLDQLHDGLDRDAPSMRMDKAFAAAQKVIPDIASQFTNDELSNLRNATPETCKQLLYAVDRIMYGSEMEQTLDVLKMAVPHHMSDEVLAKMPPPERAHLQKIATMLQDSLSGPHRNSYHNRHTRRTDHEQVTKDNTDASMGGLTMLHANPNRIEFAYFMEEDIGVAAWGSLSRTMHLADDQDFSNILFMSTLAHESAHVLQSNAFIEKIGSHEEAMRLLKMQDDQKGNKGWILPFEAEAYWIEFAFIAAMVGSQPIKEFFANQEVTNPAEQSEIILALDAWKKFSDKPKIDGELYPQGFKDYIHKMLSKFSKRLLNVHDDGSVTLIA
ncbi:hypothetical protein HOK40_00535 [Candidatus Peregrinibacteria bacterium]|jgi:hypothetical protein|nr:hypothetical protein [Candidatus Peregrinibacteria bacterium]MBT7337569.1 hypothetical protein [Candidatus Peregrinibacteria bacterium]